MLLASEINCTIAGKRIPLRPSLRNAIRLERRPGSFAGIAEKIIEGSLETACEIIRDNVELEFLESRVFDALPTLQEPLLAYVAACAGIDQEKQPANDNAASGGPPVPFRDYLENLYRIGTGWLGWPPNVTLDATPTEISEAYKGRLDFLRSIFGSSDAPAPSANPENLSDKFKSVFASMGTTIVKRPPRRAKK